MRKTSPTRKSARPVGRVPTRARKVWLAGLGSFAVARNTLVGVVEPKYRALVAEGQHVERRLIRITGDAVEQAVAAGKSVWNLASTLVEEGRAAALRTTGLAPKQARKRSTVGRLARRVEAMETEVRHAAQPR